MMTQVYKLRLFSNFSSRVIEDSGCYNVFMLTSSTKLSAKLPCHNPWLVSWYFYFIFVLLTRNLLSNKQLFEVGINNMYALNVPL